MNFKRNLICMGLVGGIFLLPINDFAASPPPARRASGIVSVKQQVGQIGVGGEVKVKLAGGEKLRGSIQAIDDQGFVLDRGQQASYRRIEYDQVAKVTLANLVYRAKGIPDPLAVSRVVGGLGVGHHIVVETTEGKKYRGNIQVIGEDDFVMVPDHQTAPVQIAYAQVHYLEQNLTKGAKIAIIVAVVFLVAVAITAIVVKSKCSNFC